MDIIISDKWLRDFLETKATPKEIAECVSLCGPSIERIEKVAGDTLYYVEITTNRIDSVGVYGFAREVAAILPRFNIPAKLKKFNSKNIKGKVDDLPFTIIHDNKLVKRTLGVVITNIKNWTSPLWMKERLTLSGLRSLNAIVDITNYVMLETGHPSHAFDYDKIKNKKFIIRESKKGEKLTSFDGKTYDLLGGDIVFDDGEGEIIDLPGIIGTKNSVVNADTKRVFFFIDNNEPTKIRNTSMRYAIRTVAASINEKGVDPELGMPALLRGIELFQDVCKAEVASKIFDNHPNPYKTKTIKTDKAFIDKKLGVNISKEEVQNYLTSLEFKPKWDKDTLSVIVPSFRSDDVDIPEDLVEEIARIYGYHNLPSKLMEGSIPNINNNSPFYLEKLIKNTLKALGGIEVYTLSLVAKDLNQNDKALRLKNALGSDTEYLRNNLNNSLVEAIKSNSGNYERIFLFEIANIYIPKAGDLPNEKTTIGMVFDGYKYIEVKGIIEAFINCELHIDCELTKITDKNIVSIKSENTILGNLIEREDGIITIEIFQEELLQLYKKYRSFIPIPKHPPQIEDLTIKIPEKVEIGKIIQRIKSVSKLVSEIELKDTFKEYYTFTISYLDPEKTLTDKEVSEIRNKILDRITGEFGVKIKE